MGLTIFSIICKRRFRSVAHAAISLRWSAKSLLKCPYKDNKISHHTTIVTSRSDHSYNLLLIFLFAVLNIENFELILVTNTPNYKRWKWKNPKFAKLNTREIIYFNSCFLVFSIILKLDCRSLIFLYSLFLQKSVFL